MDSKYNISSYKGFIFCVLVTAGFLYYKSVILTSYNTTFTNVKYNKSTQKYIQTVYNQYEYHNDNEIIIPPPGFLVWSEHCKIPNSDTYSSDIMDSFHRENSQSCPNDPQIAYIEYNAKNDTYILKIHENYKISKNKPLNIKKSKKNKAKDNKAKNQPIYTCFYQEITRSGSGGNVDKKFSLGKKFTFNDSIIIPKSADSVYINCSNEPKKTFSNVEILVQNKSEVRKRLDEWKKKDTVTIPSVLMLGIDSVSKNNLIRAMPKTSQYLYDSGWLDMSGYNKMGMNTYPNLMAILTGYNESCAYSVCKPKEVGMLDKCPFIWKKFQEKGYVTAYAEDETKMNTFIYNKKGFKSPPTDYYIRFSLMAAEKHLKIKTKSRLKFCVGNKHSADYIFDYAYNFTKRYKNDAYFGFFWTNTFSHNDLSDISSMDDRIFNYMKSFEKLGVMEKSIIIFLSDHGVRFGRVTKLQTGNLENRLPMIFFWIPKWIRKAYPDIVKALKINKNRLTSPYDVHVTLNHILMMSGRTNTTKIESADGCPKCQTLFKPVPYNRSCSDASIGPRWCTCNPYQNVPKSAIISKRLANFTIDYINTFIMDLTNETISAMCKHITLKAINDVKKEIGNFMKPNSEEIYTIILDVEQDNGSFDATIIHDKVSDTFSFSDSINRIDFYSKTSKCIIDGEDLDLRKYCFCKKA